VPPPEVRKRRSERSSAYNKAHPEKYRVWKQKYDRANRPKKRAAQQRRRAETAYDAEWRRRSKGKIKAAMHRYYERHKPALLKKCKAKNKEGVAKLGGAYVRSLLTAHSPLTAKHIPSEVVELKRAQLKLRRQVKNLWHSQKTSKS